MRHIVIAALSVTVLSGCATVTKQPMDANAATSLKSQTVAQTIRNKPDFTAMTAGKATFAIIGAFAMISAGNEIVATNKIADPADEIARGLVQSLEAKHGVQQVTPSIAVSSDDLAQISTATKGKSRYVMDVQTTNWSFAYFPTDWTHYRVIYTARARLIDADKNVVVAEGACKRVPESNVGAPTYDELLANQATLLKTTLAAAAKDCVKTLGTEMLSL